MSLHSARTRIAPAAALLAFSVLWAAGSLRADLLPNPALSTLPPLESAAIPLALFALAAGFIALLRRAPWPRGSQLLCALWIALGLFVAPVWLLQLAQNSVLSLARIALFSLVPVFATVLEPQIDPDAPRVSFGLAASLTAVLGMLLVFPLDVPRSLTAAASQGALLFAVFLIAASNCLAVRATRTLPPASLPSFAAVVAASAAAVLILSGVLAGTFRFHTGMLAAELPSASLVRLPALALLFWLFRRLSAVRMTTRFLFAPLFAAVVSACIFRPHISLAIAGGLLLIAAAAAWLLFASTPTSDPADSPLRLLRD